MTALDPDEQAFLDLHAPAEPPEHIDCPGYHSGLGATGLPWPATRQPAYRQWPKTITDLLLPEGHPVNDQPEPAPCACPTPPLHAATCPATADLWPGVAPSGSEPDPLAPFRALADQYAAKGAESTRHAAASTIDEARAALPGIAAGWRSAEFLLRHTLTDLDNHRTTPDNPATLPAQSRRPDLTIRLGKATEETFRIHLAQFGIDTPGCDCGHNEMGVEWHATDCQWRTSRTTPDNPVVGAFPTVQGRCPACRGESLFLGSGGYITCSRHDCPEPDSASTLLERRTDNAADDARRRVLAFDAFNAVDRAFNTHGQWLPLSVREAVADAVLAAVGEELERLEASRYALHRAHTALAAQSGKDQAAIALVRAIADELIVGGASWDGNEPGAGRRLIAALDGEETSS